MSSNGPEGWRSCPLGDLARVEHGFAFKGTGFAPASDGDPIVVNIGNFRYTGGFRFESTARRTYRGDYPERFRLVPGDILVAMTCQTAGGEILGIPARVPDDGTLYLHNQRIGRLVVSDHAHLDETFLYWWLASPGTNRALFLSATGSKILHTSPTKIMALPVSLPPLSEQRKIASVMQTLDDKIASNDRAAAWALAVASALFADRFGDWVSRHPLTTALPSGWKPGVVADLFEVTMGQSPPGTSYGPDPIRGPVLVQGMGGFGLRFPSSDIYTDAARKLAPAGATLMTVRAPVGAVNVAERETCLGRGVAAFCSDAPAFTEFFVRALKPRWVSEEGGTIFPAVNCTQIRQMPVGVPPSTAIKRFESSVASMVDQLSGLHRETQCLRTIRYELLPKLVSGKIRVPAAEEIVEAGDDASLEEATA